MKTSTPLFIAAIVLVAMLLSMVSCTATIENPIKSEASTIQDVYLKGSVLYYKDKPVILQDSAKELLEQGIENLPRVATYVVEYKSYYYMALD